MNSPQGQGTGAATICPLCSGAIAGQAYKVSQQTICGDCYQKIRAELAAQGVSSGVLPLAFLGGLVGSAIAGAVWIAATVMLHVEIGYAAVLIGFLSGQGTVIAAGKSRGKPLQIVAAICSAIGLVIAKLATYAFLAQHFFERKGHEVTVLSFFSATTIHATLENVSRSLTAFDLLWAFIAITVAWKQPRRSRLVRST